MRTALLWRAAGFGAMMLLGAGFAAPPALASGLVWEVENPFRFYRDAGPFEMHRRAFEAERGKGEGLPSNIIWRIERRLNTPACGDASTAITCANTARGQAFATSRLGWAARTLDSACYERKGQSFRYPAACARRYGKRTVKEDYVLPPSHVVTVALDEKHLAAAGEGECAWVWRPRGGGDGGTRTQKCKDGLTIDVPYARDRARSGVAVEVRLPDGAQLADPDIVVEDLLVVALGDSFASGESNPDRPVSFGWRVTAYGEQREEFHTADGGFLPRLGPGERPAPPTTNPRALPRRLMEDERRQQIYHPQSDRFAKAFYAASAQWMSADCHRSQYGYPFRVAMQLALENRQRAVTLVHLACSGAQVTEGLFEPQPAREGIGRAATVRAQFDQLTDLICHDGPKGRRAVNYTLPFFKYGEAPVMRAIAKRWCAPERRKRDIDLVLLSIGGNDVGFSAIAAYTITERPGDIAPIASLLGSSVRFSPASARRYLGVLDQRLVAVRDALRTGFGVAPERVVQTSYEPLQFDEKGGLCGSEPTLGMDVHAGLRLSQARLRESAEFLDTLVQRLECISGSRRDCRPAVAPGARTGFTLVTDHHAAFRRRGICARDPRRPDADGAAMAMPRLYQVGSDQQYRPYHPGYFTPYAPRWRLFRTPNDAFLTANTHHRGTPVYDRLQPPYAALFSGAIHPTAEAHAIVADHVVPYARKVVGAAARIEARSEPAR